MHAGVRHSQALYQLIKLVIKSSLRKTAPPCSEGGSDLIKYSWKAQYLYSPPGPEMISLDRK